MERILCQYSSNKSSVLQINTICFAKKNSTSKQTQSDLQIQNCIWEKMQRYGQIYVLCVTTVRLICLFMRKLGLIFSQMRVGRFSHKCMLADFLTNACWLIFSQMHVGWFSHKCVLADSLTNACVQADFLTNACWLIFSQMHVGWFSQMRNWATFFSKNSRWRCRSIYEWGTGEFLSYYLYN